MTEVDFILGRKNFDLTISEKFLDGITGIFGPNGSGKTSLLHAIAGLCQPQKGKIIVNGKVLFDSNKKINIPVEKRNIGYVFQEGRLFPHLTVEQNLKYGLKKNTENKISYEEVVQMLNLSHILSSKPARISGGESQRTAIGRALLSSPDILLLDEPFSALDIHLRQQILPFIWNIQRNVNIPILVVSHDLPDLLKLTNTLCLMQEGRCQGHGVYHELLRDSRLAEAFGGNPLVNALDMKVLETGQKSGLALLGCLGQECSFTIKSKAASNYQPGQELKVIIQSDDIALAVERIPLTSIQNQIKGEITDLIRRENSTICLINAGIPLIVEITENSREKLGLHKGDSVWCLFKSVAIEVVG